jgi:uncharacterized membrane protein
LVCFAADFGFAALPLAALANAVLIEGFLTLADRVRSFLRTDFFAISPGIIGGIMADNIDELEPAIFSATVTPHRSLGNVGFLVLMIVFGGVSFFAGIAFLLMGAWPVFGFFGLDVLILYWAFRLNYRRATAYEEIKVTASTLTVRKTGHHGDVREWRFNPLWVKLDREAVEDFGIARLFLVTRGKQLTVAGFLGPREKEGFAEHLDKALAEARCGSVRTASN